MKRLCWLGLVVSLLPVGGWAQDFAGGAGSVADPYQITTWHHFNNIRNHLDAHFVIDNPLTPDTEGYEAHVKAGETLVAGGLGWAPLAGCVVPGDPTTCIDFEGSLDGQHHPIVGLEMARGSTTEVGIFSRIGATATVKNLNVVALEVTGGQSTGGLAGVNQGTVMDVTVQGAVTGSSGRTGGVVGLNIAGGQLAKVGFYGSVTGEDRTGGLAGSNLEGTVERSWARVEVTSTQGRVGGAIGQHNSDHSVDQVFTTGSVSGDTEVGGLVGEAFDDVKRSYSTAAVTATNGVAGGLIGQIGDTTATVNIDESYATGKVSGDADSLGLVGNADRSDISAAFNVTDSFWDVDTSELGTTGTDAVGAEGLSTANMQNPNTFTAAGWDLTSGTGDWIMLVGVTYPRLLALSFGGGAGTAETPHLIDHWEHLDSVRLDLDAHFKLTRDLNQFSPGYVTHVKSSTGLVDGGRGWDPLGDFVRTFEGVFDGNQKTIADLEVARPAESYVGLFGQTALGGNMQIKNLTLQDHQVTGSTWVGAVVGNARGGALTAIHANGEVTGGAYVGGVVGEAEGTLDGLSAAGSVTGQALTGGVAGSLISASATDLTFQGEVSGTSFVGGLVGSLNIMAPLNRSHANATVTGTGESVGGLVGSSSSGLTEVYATGSVTGLANVGGLVGQAVGSVTRSYATAAATATDGVAGGLIGGIGDTTADVSIIESWSAGAVTGNADSLGLVGNRSRPDNSGAISVIRSFWDVTTSGVGESGDIDALGAVGKTTLAMKKPATFTDAEWDLASPGGDWAIETGFWASYPYLQSLDYDTPGAEPAQWPLPGLVERTTLPAAEIEVTALSVERGFGQLIARWEAPTDLKGAAVTGYRVTLDGEVVCELSANDPLECIITGLQSSQRYAVAVLVLTPEGESPIDRQQSASPLPPVPVPVDARIALGLMALLILIIGGWARRVSVKNTAF